MRAPGRLSYASVGAGSASHLTMELLKSDAQLSLVHVPYRGFPPAVTDMLAGNMDAMFAIIPAVLPYIRAGKMTPLAVTALERSPLAPEVPTSRSSACRSSNRSPGTGSSRPPGRPRASLHG